MLSRAHFTKPGFALPRLTTLLLSQLRVNRTAANADIAPKTPRPSFTLTAQDLERFRESQERRRA